MENNYYVPAQIIENNLKGAVGKANLKLHKMIMMGFFAGMFIAIGAEGSNLAVHTIDNFGLAKTLAGCIFPVGLMMIMFTLKPWMCCTFGKEVFETTVQVTKGLLQGNGIYFFQEGIVLLLFEFRQH